MASVTRLYDSHDKAMAVKRELTEKGFTDDQIKLVQANHADAQSGSHDHLMTTLTDAGVARAEAAGYADRLRQGATLLSVNAPYGRGAQATAIMDQHSPAQMETVHKEAATGSTNSRGLIDEPAPLSRLLGLPVLLHGTERQR